MPRTAPGDLVELSGVRTHARFARARAARVVEPGPGRIAPRCRHYLPEACGGCQLQHLDYATQLEAKRVFVADALKRIGGLEVVVLETIPADDPWGYRSRITLTVGPGRRFAGFHRLGEPAAVFPLERCDIAAPPLIALWHGLRQLLHLLPPDASQLVLRQDRAARLHLVIKARGDQAWEKGKRLGAELAAREVQAVVWWQPERGAPRVMSGEAEAFPATVFEQVHPALGDRIRRWALARLDAHLGDHAWDLYSGIGETTRALYAAGATVESVELDRRAVMLAEERWRAELHQSPDSQRPEPAGVVRHVGRVEELVGTLRDPALVIANPPRAGLDGRVLAVLAARRPRRMVYISCDPATLARDLGRLCGTQHCEAPGLPGAPSYRVIAVQPFDLFPQTAHVETVALLEV